jgi:hypothetical protein
VVYPCIILLCLTLFPTLNIRLFSNWRHSLFIDLPLLILGSGALALFYSHARLRANKSVLSAIALLPALLCIGIGVFPRLSKVLDRHL